MTQHWGVYNSVEKRFVFGIDKPSKSAAWKAFRKKYTQKYVPWRYELRPIPPDWVNKRNPFYENSKSIVYNKQEK